jgi:hypothetical protein
MEVYVITHDTPNRFRIPSSLPLASACRYLIQAAFQAGRRTLLLNTLSVIITGAVIEISLSACHSTAAAITGGVVGATVIGSRAVGSEIQQTYYLGVFDPQGQVPAQVYRLRVHGQGSALGFTKFASGWEPAVIADTLGTNIGFDKDTANVTINPAAKGQTSDLKTDRRLLMFGPEGFREAPADQRLVIVMGSDPSKYFAAIDTALGAVSDGKAKQKDQQSTSQLSQSLLQQLTKLDAERDELHHLSKEIDRAIPAQEGAQ